MKRTVGFFKLIKLFFQLVYLMLRHHSKLDNNFENNYMHCQMICKSILNSAGVHATIIGREKILTDKPFLLVPNHRCFFDVVLLMAVMEQPMSFVAAKELWSYPVLRDYLSAICCIPLDRYAKNLIRIKNNISEIQKSLSERSLVMFPEGECSYEREDMKPFKKGGFMGVTGMDVYIIPAYIKIDSFQRIGRKWMIPQGNVQIFLGNAFEPGEIADKRAKAGKLAAYAQRRVIELKRDA